MKINIDDVKFVNGYYPRDGFDNETVNSYRLNIDALPPITLTKDLILVDGYHRLIAHRVEGHTQIEVEEPLLDIPADNHQIYIEAIKRNALHGKQLTQGEKRRAAQRLFQEGFDDKEFKTLLGVRRSTLDGWLKDLRKERREERNQEILDLYLAGYTQEEMGEKFNLDDTSVSKILKDLKNAISGKIQLTDSLQLFNVWNFAKCDSRYGLDSPGRIPGQIVENLLYYYTDPFDLIVDPMAGGGTTIDVCKAHYRRYLAYDIKPVREDIQKHDIRNGFPPKARGCDLIFLDPPYWRLQKERYGQQSPSFDSIDEWLEFMSSLATACFKTVKTNGYAALLIEAFLDERATHSFLDLPAKCLSFFEKAGFIEVQRISTPMSTQIKDHHDVQYAKERKVLLDLNRDLIIFKKQ